MRWADRPRRGLAEPLRENLPQNLPVQSARRRPRGECLSNLRAAAPRGECLSNLRECLSNLRAAGPAASACPICAPPPPRRVPVQSARRRPARRVPVQSARLRMQYASNFDVNLGSFAFAIRAAESYKDVGRCQRLNSRRLSQGSCRERHCGCGHEPAVASLFSQSRLIHSGEAWLFMARRPTPAWRSPAAACRSLR
jgi:hypothetical protein